MKKIFAIALGLIVNVVVILELFLNCATADSTGIPANIMACVQELYDHEVLTTALFLVGLGGATVIPFVILSIMRKSNVDAQYVPGRILMGLEFLIDTCIAFGFGCAIGGFNGKAVKMLAIFSMYAVVLLVTGIIAIKLRRLKSNGIAEDGRV